jgi:hypothetical protein
MVAEGHSDMWTHILGGGVQTRLITAWVALPTRTGACGHIP